MMRNWQLFFLLCCLSSLARLTYGVEKWSRQLEPGSQSDGDSSLDWIPLAQPTEGAGGATKDRSENGRVLTYSQTFPPNARFGEYPKQQNAPHPHHQSFQDFPYQFQRFPLKSPNSQQQEPTSQSFFKFEMPFSHEGGRLPGAQPSLQTGYQIQHSFNGGQGQATLYSSQLYNQQPLFNDNFQHVPQKSLQAQPLLRKPSIPQHNYIDESLPIKSPFRESKPVSPLQSLSPQTFPVNPKPESLFEVNKPSPQQTQQQYQPRPAANAPSQQEEVQLVYVPYDSYLNRQQQQQQQQQQLQEPAPPPPPQHSSLDDGPTYELNRFHLNPALPAVNPYQINQFYTQDPLDVPHQPSFYTTSTTSRPKTTPANPSHLFNNFVTPQFTTSKPKPKAHQPPLAMFLMRKSSRPSQSDVVTTLRNSETIAVIDGPTKESPNVFVGPAGMPIPDGYVKFDLPYLSQLSQAGTLNDVPFFVAPLSYRTPNGFNKILLPEPHVGSIVVNRAKDNYVVPSQPTYAPTHSTKAYSATTQQTRVHQRIKQPTSTKDYYPDILREPSTRHQPQFEVTTQRSSPPTRGHKFSYYIDQEEGAHPKIKQDRPKKKRPQSVQVEQPVYTQIQSNQYEPFNAIPNENYYKIQTSKAPASTSTSSTSTSTTSTSTTTTTTTPAPSTYFPYNSSPQVEFHSSSGQLYPSYNTVASSQAPEQHTPRFSTRPPPTTPEDEYRMKQYFRQQGDFRNRPQVNNPTYSPFEQVQYTPIEVSIPSSTAKPAKQRYTFYTPMDTTAAPNIFNTLVPQENTEKGLPQNHRPSYNPNEISDGNVEYEPNPYQLPSELPPLTPNLPGQVNDLQENKAHSQVAQESTTPLNEVETATRPTRRPVIRTRKPLVSKVTSSVSYSESESPGKRVTNRLRRPYSTRGNANTDENSEASDDTPTTTRRPSSATRNSSVRNPNRIRYKPTPEERQSLRVKPKKGYKGAHKDTPAEDLEYQRDVLKQNYPVFRPGSSSSSSSSRRPTSPTAIPSSYAITSTEGASETQQVYTVTPSNNEQIFPAGMLEPMQIAQQYNQYSKENYGPGYFPNQEDLNPTEPVRNEVNPVYSASTATPTTSSIPTTTEAAQTTTKRSLFIRRNYPRLRPTTTEVPATTTLLPEERTTTRSRIPPRKVIKVRTRNRRPTHPASSTANTPEEEQEPEPAKNSYRKLNRFNQDLYERDTTKRRYKTQFHLEGQESQWSPAVKEEGKENFVPIALKDSTNKNMHDFESEPEIVTIGPENKQRESDTYEISVSADYDSKKRNSSLRGPNLKPEKSFAELLEEVMGKSPDERPLSEESTSTTRTTEGTYFESQKTTIGNLIGRRGKWKKQRVQAAAAQNDSFEAAESQNIGEQLLNKIYEDREKLVEKLKTTTPLSPAVETSMPLNPVTEYATVDTVESFATIQPETTTMTSYVEKPKTSTTIAPETKGQETEHENASRKVDLDVVTTRTPAEDLDSQPSIFSEVKRQLHDLFAIDDTEDQAVTAALAAVKRNKEYTSIKRTRPPPTTTVVTPTVGTTESIVGTTTPGVEFHKNLMDHLVYSTSTSTDTKVSSETEICYRGRCIRSEDLPSNHKLQ